ncbi:MAG: prolipoprotein diacylglyceryl transferase [Ignavibacteria bacterium]|nr:prolipoprotein diacylglyceryl transferase [Ignavibacteria bacterium]
MYPELLHLGPVTIYSYGLMLGVAFLVSNLLITRELRRLGQDPTLATTVTMFALVGGVAGAKLFHLLENWSEFLANPGHMLLSSGGLTWYGGFLLATLLIFLYFRRRKLSLMAFADVAAPSLALGYGFGRVGCQLAGDGDYGIPSHAPWAMTYPNGTVSTLASQNPGLAQQYADLFPGQPVPADIPVHPAPVYEIILAVALFSLLQARRKKPLPVGSQFGLFLVLHGLCRFGVEFIRLNPLLVLGLSQAQLISLALVAWGAFLLFKNAPVATPKARA